MTIAIVLGAGASYGSGDCSPHCPPLGAQLFSALQQRGRTAAKVTPALAALFARDFELGMATFREERDRDTTAFLRDMAEYFVEFTAGPANFYHELIAIVRDAGKQVVLVTTNYDLLLEQAITEAGLRIAYHPPPVPRGNVPLLKIHGSCHFIPDVGGARLTGVTFSGNVVNVEAPIRIAMSRQEVRDFCASEDSLAPAISVYAPGKAVLFSSAAVKQQQQHWLSVLAATSTVYLIGLRVVTGDEHIWCALERADARIEYVGFEPDIVRSWASAANRDNVYVLAKTFEEALPLLRSRLSVEQSGVAEGP